MHIDKCDDISHLHVYVVSTQYYTHQAPHLTHTHILLLLQITMVRIDTVSHTQ